jgi:ABC-type branched-subunit amino acid transport system permease subunit
VLKSIREDEIFAQALGKNVASCKVLVFVIGAGMASVAGVMYAYYRLSHIKFHKARGRRLYCNTPTTDNALKFIM